MAQGPEDLGGPPTKPETQFEMTIVNISRWKVKGSGQNETFNRELGTLSSVLQLPLYICARSQVITTLKQK